MRHLVMRDTAATKRYDTVSSENIVHRPQPRSLGLAGLDSRCSLAASRIIGPVSLYDLFVLHLSQDVANASYNHTMQRRPL